VLSPQRQADAFKKARKATQEAAAQKKATSSQVCASKSMLSYLQRCELFHVLISSICRRGGATTSSANR
jgi:hypothetical protein